MSDNNDEILKILNENYSEKIQSISFLREGGCKSYIAEGENERFFVKEIGNAFADTAKQSAEIVGYLNGRGFPVPKTIPNIGGKDLTEKGEKLYIMSELVEGAEADIDKSAEKIGMLTGKLHLLMKKCPSELSVRGSEFFIERYIKILREIEYAPSKVAEFAAIGRSLWDRVKHLPLGGCHGDLHIGNTLETEKGEIYLLDFDTVCFAPRMFDIAVMCDVTDYHRFMPDGLEKAKAIYSRFLKGYTKYCSLSEAEIGSFSCFVAIRHFQLQATIMEIYGNNCVNTKFIDNQLDWIKKWVEQTKL